MPLRLLSFSLLVALGATACSQTPPLPAGPPEGQPAAQAGAAGATNDGGSEGEGDGGGEAGEGGEADEGGEGGRGGLGEAELEVLSARVKGILEEHCASCHGGGTDRASRAQGSFGDVLNVASMIVDAPGDNLPARLVPGKPDETRIWIRVRSDSMPNGPVKLTADEKEALKAWIEADAPDWKKEE